MSQKEKAALLRKLHNTGKILIFPNIWDPMGAILLESMGYPAIATASASIALSNGFKDGENIPFNDLVRILANIVEHVSVPVTADIESGFAATDKGLSDNIKRLVSIGVAGINIEDTDKATGKMYPIEKQVERLHAVREASAGADLFINARTDVYLQGNDFAGSEARLDETLRRGDAYKKAGADCFFPVILNEKESIITIVQHLNMPVNIITVPGIPGITELEKMGVARLSLGPSLFRITVKAIKETAAKLLHHEDLPEITDNEISTAYLSKLLDNTGNR